MERQRRPLEPVEFQIVKNPEIRVIFADYENSVIQVLTGDRSCHFRGTEHRLWLFSRTFVNDTSEAFAEQATERCRSQASRVCMLQDRLEELETDLRTAKERYLVEQAVRARLEKELTSRDGYNRTQRKVADMLRTATVASSRQTGVTR